MTSGEGVYVYDGFISYSHIADDLLAPRLQAGLQRFAKPWWKRRAVHVFRDEAVLSANPHLWGSIVDAMEKSEWFVLLLSREAARSEWVDREVSWWLEHKEASRIIPVVTDGEFTWNAGIMSDAAPPSLESAFTDEPRWVDLRFANDEEHLDLKDPRFADAVADIASALRGIPKDELASEEVRQHRRTMRTAWLAGIVVAVLGVAAVVFGLQADQQRRLAEENQRIADENALEAEHQAETALENERVAKDNEERAVEQSRIAEARRLVALSRNELESEPELALLLTVYAEFLAPKASAQLQSEIGSAVEDALRANRLIGRFPITRGSGHRAVLSPDGTTVYHGSDTERTVTRFSVATGEIEWEWPVPDSADIGQLEVSPDGSMLVVALNGAGLAGGPQARLVVIDAADKSIIKEVALGDCDWTSGEGSGFSPDGQFFTQLSGTAQCLEDGSDDWVIIFDTATWEEFKRVASSTAEPPPIYLQALTPPVREGSLDVVLFSQDAETTVISGFYSSTELRRFEDGQLLRDFGPSSDIAYSPSGDRIMLQPVDQFGTRATRVVIDLTKSGPFGGLHTTELITARDNQPLGDGDTDFNLDRDHFRRSDAASFSPDGDKLAVTQDGVDYVFLLDGDTRIVLNDHGPTLQHSWSEDSSLLLTVSEDGWILLWETGELSSFDLVSAGLDRNGTISFARQALTRGFTAAECTRLDLASCPTLEDLRAR